jgi:RNA polymerase sigma-70 factor (ECF subfamily)
VTTGTDAFVKHRNLLFTVAYEMLGSAADAEDVIQETWLRWAEVDRAEVRDDRAYLVRIATRLSLNRLRTLARQRETYVGPWLPEPLLTTPDVADDLELADSVSTAMLVVLETLTPTERAVFVLREVFDVGYDEIAAAVDKSPAAVRQIAHRAPQPRGGPAAARAGDRAAARGDPRPVRAGGGVRRPAVADGRARARRRADDRRWRGQAGGAPADPGPGQGAAVPGGAATKGGPIDAVHRTLVNGRPALAFVIDGRVDTLLTILVEDGVVAGLYAVRNPAKLTRLDEAVTLTR